MRILSLAVAATALSVPASAAITFHEIAHWNVFQQTSAAQPTTPTSGLFTARVFSNVANEVTTGTVTTPATAVKALNPQGALIASFSQSFANGAAAVAAYGAGTYTFGLTAGTYNGQTDTVDYGDPGWADQVPYLTNYAALQSLDVNQPFTMTWSNWGATGDHTSLVTYLTVFDITANTQVFSGQAPQAGFTSKLFAAGTFQQGHQYRYQLTFGALTQEQTTGGFSPSKATATTYTLTSGTFEPVPEPATMSVLAMGLLGALRRNRRRGAE